MIEIDIKQVPHQFRNKYMRRANSGGVYNSIAGSGSDVDISGKLDKVIWDENFKEKTDPSGKDYLFLEKPLVCKFSATFYADESPLVPSIFEGLPLDNTTLQWIDGKISVVGGVGKEINGIRVNGRTFAPDAERYITIPDYPTELSWSAISGKPFTLAGYGIIDAPTKTGEGASGNWGINIQGESMGVRINNNSGGDSMLQYMQFVYKNDAGDNPFDSWCHMLKMNHGNGDTYFNRTLAFDFFSDRILTRRRVGGTAQPWREIAFTDSNVASASNADKLDGYHINDISAYINDGYSTYLGDIDSTPSSTTAFITELHRQGHMKTKVSFSRGAWWYAGTPNFNTGVGNLDMAGTAVWAINHNNENNPLYKSMLFLTADGELFSFVGQEAGWEMWSKYAKTTDNVVSASRLQIPRTIFGQSFNGENDISIFSSGKMRWLDFTAMDGANAGYIGRVSDTSNNVEVATYYDNIIIRPAVYGGSGYVGIGTPNPQAKLHVAGNIFCDGAATFRYPSDRTLKKNIRPVKNASERLLSMGGVFDFEYIEDEVSRNSFYAGEHIGFMYQNVKGSYMDKMCHEREDGKGTINHLDNSFISLLAAVEIEHEDRIRALEDKLNTIERRLQ